MDRQQFSRNTSQQGTTLVEILITMVLVAIGLLGLAGLQLTTVQNTNSSTERFDATTLAKDILERMRANRDAAIAGNYDIAIGENAVAGNLAGDDLVAWQAALDTLPSGKGAVEVQPFAGAIGGGLVTITVQWTDASDDSPQDNREATVFLRSEL